MNRLIPRIRNTPRAIILQQQQLLLLLKRDAQGERYALPGGAQEPGESLEQALQRECMEEINCEVQVQRLLLVADAYKPSTSQPDCYKHQLEFFFHCQLPEGYQPCNGSKPDKHQVDVVWLPLDRIDQVLVYPPRLAELLAQVDFTIDNVYAGLLNA